jgi:polar amino acid transport system permease protein
MSARRPATRSPLIENDAAGRMDDCSDFLICRHVSKAYGDRPVLRDVSFSVPEGSVCLLMGRSGSGKSTLLRLINHLERIDGGEILLGGRYVGYELLDGELAEVRNVTAARVAARIGMVFQQFALFEHMTAAENVAAALRYVYGVGKLKAMDQAASYLQRVGLAGLANHYPRHLSGGQQQRVAIARALATQPRLMLFDEPTSALDPELTAEVRAVMRELAEVGLTMLVATHDVPFARQSADSVIVLHDGVIIESGPAHAVLENPRSPEARQLLQILGN